MADSKLQDIKPASIPLVDLGAQYEEIRHEIWEALNGVIARSSFVGGQVVADFEDAFAEHCGAKHAIGVGNGTDALTLALRGFGVGQGDEVITVPNTFTATAEAIVAVGARPVFVDVEPRGMNINPEQVSDAVGTQTKAIIPVHLYGQMADMSPVLEIAERHGLKVLEDAAQAHGAEYSGHRAGTMGHAAAFSFYPGKNLGAYGDAGAITTDDDDLAECVRMTRDHGRKDKYIHSTVGVNSRLDGIQAAVLSVKLAHLAEWTERRRALARLYDEALAPIEDIETLEELPRRRHVYHLYVVRAARRDQLLGYLKEHGISAGIHYPHPLHLQPAYEFLGYRQGQFPVAERAATEIISLPIYPEMKPDMVSRVAETVAAFYSG